MSYKKKIKCEFCSLPFESLDRSQVANHSRWCKSNPKRQEYVVNLKRVTLAAEKLNQYSKAKKDGRDIPVNPRKGKFGFKGTPHTDETKKILREKALASNHRRLCRKPIEYKKKDGSTIMLDSSWEVIVAERLDELNVEWNRPEPLPYIGTDGKIHNYFPDFYLPKFDVYLDPKNPAAYNAQKDKIEVLSIQLTNLIIIRSKDACKSFTPYRLMEKT